MHKVLAIAARDFKAAVRTKSFLITVLLMPVFMGGSAIVQGVLKKQSSAKDRRIAVVDRTPNAQVFEMLSKAAERRNERDIFDADQKQVSPKFILEKVEPSEYEADAVDRQRLELSKLVKGDTYWGFVEIGPDAHLIFKRPASQLPEGQRQAAAERQSLRYQTNHLTSEEFPNWAEKQLIIGIAGVTAEQLERPPMLRREGLSEENLATGKIEDPKLSHRVARFVVPAAFVALMFVIIMLSTTPAMQGVVEEKMQRIAEVMLGSVTPFQLMLGKLLGVVGVSIAVAAVYLGGAYWAAYHYEFTQFLPFSVLSWYIVFQILAVFMYGAIFLAIGAASTDIKETQTLVMPVMLLACLPLFVLGTAMEDSKHPLVVAMSYFPPATPMLFMARVALDPAPAWWEPFLAVLITAVATIACVWAAGRIFRVGILLQGKGAKLGQILQWLVRA